MVPAGLRYRLLMAHTADGTLLPPLDALDRSSAEDDAPLDLDRGEGGRTRTSLLRPRHGPEPTHEPVDLATLGGPSTGAFMKLR